MTELVRPEDLREAVLVSDDPPGTPRGSSSGPAWGSTPCRSTTSATDQPDFLDVFGAKVLPELRAVS